MIDFIVSNLNSEKSGGGPSHPTSQPAIFLPNGQKNANLVDKNVNGGEHTPSLMAGKQRPNPFFNQRLIGEDFAEYCAATMQPL
jgi:hypothetical protein